MSFIFLFLVFLLANCNPVKEQPTIIHKQSIEEKIDSLKRAEEHKQDSIQSLLYKNLNEPDLMTVNYEVYRLMAWYAFHYESYILRIEKKDNGCYLTVKTFLPAYYTKNKKDSIMKDTVIALADSTWKAFKHLINGCYFWSLDRHEPGFVAAHYFDGYIFCMDGYISSFSSADTTFYKSHRFHHTVERQCPYEGSFQKAGAKLVELSGIFKNKK